MDWIRTTATTRRPLYWLAAGVVAGVALAAVGLLQTDARLAKLPDGVVASVNGTFIHEDAWQRLVAGLDADTREPVTPQMAGHVLDRMIEEELLVQRGLELGLAESDRRVRADITQAMIRSVVTEAEDDPPSEKDLRDFYKEQSAFFRQPGRLRVRQVFFRVPRPDADAGAQERARAARARLAAGEPFEKVKREAGDSEVSPVPDALLPPAKLREYVGPTALRAVMALEPGQIGQPVRSGTGWHVFQLVEREDARTPPFEEIEKEVRAEWTRRAGDRALRRYLDDLRARADVRVRDGVAKGGA